MFLFFWSPKINQLFVILLIITAAFTLAKLASYLVGRAMRRSAELLKVDRTKYAFLQHFITAVIYTAAVIAIVYSIPKLRTLAVSMFAGAGILALVIGLASQQAFSNIVSGVFMVMSKPFKVGDRIEIGKDYVGIVEDITLRHTIIRNFENRRIVIPNSRVAAETIVNSHLLDETIRRQIDFTIDYSANLDLAMNIMREECEKHPKCIDLRTPEEINAGVPKVDVRLMAFQDSAILLRAYAWAANNAESFDLHTDVNISIKKRFDAAGISIPFPQRVISYREGHQKS